MCEDLRRNRLLALLTEEECEQLARFCFPIAFSAGQSLRGQEEGFANAYFPCSGVITNELIMPGGIAVPVTAVGSEGAICSSGEPPFSHTAVQWVGRVAGEAWFVPSASWPDVIAQKAVRTLLTDYQAICLSEAQQTAACHLLHDVESRLCRWLLHMHDRMDGDTLQMTHAEIANLTSIRRTTVTLIVGSLETAGIIANRRGAIHITDRFALEAAACECYGTIRRLHRRTDNKTIEWPSLLAGG
jgi:CRP-like cAMP-binding protein